MLARFIKKAAGWFVGFGLMMFALILCASFALRTDRFKNAVEAYVNGHIPGRISYETLDLSLFRGAVEAVNFRLDDPEGKALVKAKRVYLNLSWLALIARKVHLNTLELDDPDVYLETDTDGNLNIISAFSKYPPKGADESEGPFELPMDVTFGTLELNQGVLHYKDIDAPDEPDEEVFVKGLSLKASKGNINRRSGLVRLELGPCDIHIVDMNSHIENLAVEGVLKRDVLSKLTLHLDSDMGICDIKGSITDLWTGPRYDLDVTLDASLEGIDKVFDVECELTGRVTGGGTVKGHWDDPDIDAVLHCDGGKVLGSVVGDLDLSATLSGRVIDIRRLFVNAPGGTGTIKGFVYFNKAFKEGFFTSDFIEPEFAYDLKADQVWTKPYLVPGIPEFMKGRVRSSLSFKGKGFFFESMVAKSDISATADGFCFFDGQLPETYRLATAASMDHSKLSVKQFELEDAKSLASLKGLYRTDTDAWAADITLRSDDLSRSTFIQPYGDFKGRLDLESSLKGTLDVFSGKIRSLGRDLVWDGVACGQATVDGFLQTSGVFSIERATLNHPKAIIAAKGDIGVFDGRNAMDLDVTFRDLDAGYVLDETRLKGVCEGNLILRGVVDDPVGDLKLKGRNLAWDQYTLGALETDAQYGKGRVNINDLTLVNKQSVINLKGSALVYDMRTDSFFDDPFCDYIVDGKNVRIEEFYPPVKGLLSVSGKARGPLTRPHGYVELEGKSIDLVKQSFERIKGVARLEGENIVIERFSADVKDGETLEASGRVSIVNENYDLALKTEGVSINHVDVLGKQNICEGKIAVDLEGQGKFDQPEFNGKVAVLDVKVNNEAFDDADLDVSLNDGMLSVNGKAMADIDADLDIDTLDFNAKVLFNDTAIEPFFRMAGMDGMQGEITGELKSSGNLDKLDDMKASAVITDLLVKDRTMTLVRNNALDIAYAKKRFHIQESRLVLLDKGYLVLGGDGSKDGDLDLYVKGAIPLTVVDLFSDELSGASGDVYLDGRIGGTFDKPDIRADVDIRAAAFMIPELMQNIHDVNGHVKVKSQNITIETIKGKLDSGNFSISGGLTLDKFKPAYLSLNVLGEALPITVPDMLDVTMNTKITVKGTPDDSLIEGNLVILYGKYYKDVSLDLVNVVKKNRTAGPKVKRFTEPYLRSMGLNLSVTHKNPFEVDNNIAYLPLKPDLKILGTLNNPRLSGRAEVDVDNKGIITYQGKVFDVTKGRVDFINPYIIEPLIDVQCQTEIRNWIIYLLISGTPENLKFSMTSGSIKEGVAPLYEDADILSLLVLGKTTEEILEGNGDKTQSAAKLLAGIVSGNLEKNIKDATGIDTVEVEYITTTNTTTTNGSTSGDGTTNETIENGVKVTLGKELSERLTLKYGVETTGGVTIHRADSEYRFFENMLMNAFQDTENKYGAELIYRIEFR
ncbi:MAG: translocation/assembly module TamB domain-containing protein [Desulfobacteraceae bacterium]|jgi:autotransporter translocation and assembly factor TamB